MKRRTFLATLSTASALGLAGCTNRGTPTETDPAPSTDTRSETPSDTPTESPSETDVPEMVQRQVSLTSQDSVPDKYNLDITIELLRDIVTAEESARLRLTITNTGDERALNVHGDMCHLFNRNHGASDDPAGLWLHQPGAHSADKRVDGKWTLDRDPDDMRGWPAYACGSQSYAAGESQTTEYVLWDDYQVEGYFEPGTYRWEETIGISDTSDDQFDPESKVRWGFELKVIDPHA